MLNKQNYSYGLIVVINKIILKLAKNYQKNF